MLHVVAGYNLIESVEVPSLESLFGDSARTDLVLLRRHELTSFEFDIECVVSLQTV